MVLKKTNKAYEYCKKSVDLDSTPKYVKLQILDFMNTYEGNNDKYLISQKKYDQLESILKLLIMPKGLKAGKTLYDCTMGYQWLFYTAILCTVYRDNPKKRRYETGLLEICRKNFKALSLDTPIPTPSGWRNMGDINVGDYVFGKNGNPTMVIGESEIFDKPMYLVTFEDGEKIKASSTTFGLYKQKQVEKLQKAMLNTIRLVINTVKVVGMIQQRKKWQTIL